ncbi:MAG: hypothetical protein IKM06_01100 [Clostridia bacterium]|nr:hypothetical protein [Clostridia bacterium]
MKKILTVILLCSVLFASGCSKKENAATATGTVSFTVVDGFSGLPIENVKIVIPECEAVSVTDSSGKTERITVPVIKDERYPIPEGYGTFSVLGFCEGYNDYALFFAHISEQQERSIKLYMFKTDTPFSSGAPLSTIESPNKEWVSKLMEKYR